MGRKKSNKPKRDQNINFKVFKREKDRIEERAKSLFLDTSEYIRNLIDKDLNKNKDKK